MKRIKRVIAVLLLLAITALTGYMIYTCNRLEAAGKEDVSVGVAYEE